MAERFSLKDHLFNENTVAQLGAEYASAVPGFDRARFERDVLGGFPERELMARLDWIADCLEPHLPRDFNEMAGALEAAMPPILDPAKTDDDFGHFIYAVPGILAVRHGLEDHRERAMALLFEATQRFSMEFYIRAFLNRWPDETLSTLNHWAEHENYHVRRLVSEGTRPKLPWARAVSLTPDQTLPLLDKLHADPTRYVTRSVSNHLNDLSKTTSNRVIDRLQNWRDLGRQGAKELDWMTRYALRTLIKTGDADAMALLGFRRDIAFDTKLRLSSPSVQIGNAFDFECTVTAPADVPVLIDYRISFSRPGGKTAEKVFKLKQAKCLADKALTVKKSHKLKADATTFTWHPGPHKLTLQINGIDCAETTFDVLAK